MLKLDPCRYSKNNLPQRNDVNYVLDNYLKFMNFRKIDNIIDVGTGDGTVLIDDLLPRVSQNFTKVVAMDINEDMLHIARTKSKNNPKIEFVCMDIGTSMIPLELRENFDHLFSFFCLQWVPDQKQAFRNLFSLLKSGGDILLIIVTKNTLFDIHEKMASIEEWAPFMHDYDKIMGPCHRVADPMENMEMLLDDVGFVDYKCELIDRQFAFENFSAFWEWSLAINPFINRIPMNKIDLYEKKLRDNLMSSKSIRFENGIEGNVYFLYQLLIVFAAKPENISL